MSGVLDRMVQRARGELPAVEPLVPAQRTVLGARAGFAVEDVERDVTGENPQQLRERPPLRRMARPDRTMEAYGASSVAGAASSTEKMQPADWLGTHASEDRHAEQTRLMFEGSAMNVAAQGEPGSGGPEGGTAIPQGGADSRTERSRDDAPGEDAARRVVEAEMVSRASGLAPREVEIHQAALAESETAARRGEMPKTNDQEQHKPFQVELRAPELAVHAEAPVIETGEHTEIHISIGSIELHAPRPEAKAPPFRPRVTLDEFLRRRPGVRS
jgi:hypothetical protein